MSTVISFSRVCVNLRRYHDQATSIKEKVVSLIAHTPKAERYSDFMALDNVSFNVKEGERLGIVGANGAGKSTLLRTICSIYPASSGDVVVKGDVAPLLEIGAGFNPELTGRENIYLNGAALGHSASAVRRIEPEIVEFSELADFMDTPVKYYSTGMYMRLAFSVATAVKPDILVLDEVFAGGDAHFIGKATERMESFINQARALVFVSHQLDLVKRLCPRVIWLDNGRIRADGPVEDVLAQYIQSAA